MRFELKKRTLTFLLAALMIFTCVPYASAVQYPCTGFAASALTIYRQTSAQSEIVLNVPAGDALYITGESGSYYIVEYEGRQGYVSKSSVVLSGQTEENKAFSQLVLVDSLADECKEGPRVEALLLCVFGDEIEQFVRTGEDHLRFLCKLDALRRNDVGKAQAFPERLCFFKIALRIHGGVDCADGRAEGHAGGNPQRFKRADYADLIGALGAAAAENQRRL